MISVGRTRLPFDPFRCCGLADDTEPSSNIATLWIDARCSARWSCLWLVSSFPFHAHLGFGIGSAGTGIFEAGCDDNSAVSGVLRMVVVGSVDSECRLLHVISAANECVTVPLQTTVLYTQGLASHALQSVTRNVSYPTYSSCSTPRMSSTPKGPCMATNSTRCRTGLSKV